MIDVNKITSTLAKLPDAQLQQYAQMHKSDPYIMALAMSESGRRKELRAAGQASQGAQQQPKVVDQEIAQMAPQQLPEEQGIGQLPAGNMNFANGGIIAFADGGDVERYQYGGTIYDPVTGVPISAENTSGNDLTMLESLGVFNPENRRTLEQAEKAAALREARPALGKPTMPAQGYTRTDPRATGADTFAESVKAVGAAPTADTGRRAAPGAGLAAAAAVPAQSASQRYADMQKEMGMGPEASADMEWKRSQLAERKRAQTKGELEEFEKDVATRGEAFKGREDRLAKREAGLGKMKDETAGLALLEAGLAIMSTPGGLATAIGKGAQTGLKTYGAGLEKLRSAQEKMDDARDQIEEFRRNEANMTAKERRQFKSAINRTETEIEKDSLDAAEKMYGYKREDAKAVFAASTQERLTDKEIGAANARSAAQIAATLNTPDRILFDQLLKKNSNDAVKALEEFKTAKGDKFDVRSSYADYLKAFAGKEGLTPPMSMGAYAGQFGATLPR